MVDETLFFVPAATYLYIMEIAIFFFTLPFNVLLIAMFVKMSTIRPDLKVLMLSFPFSFCTVIITRCVLILIRFMGQPSSPILYSVHDSAIVYFSIGFIGVSIECAMATLSLHEPKTPFFLGFFLVSFQLVISAGINAWKAFLGLNYITFNGFVMACNILSLGIVAFIWLRALFHFLIFQTDLSRILMASIYKNKAFPILWAVNKKCYMNSQRNRHLHTLADRYHIKENLQNIHSLIFLASLNTFVTFSTSALMFYLNFGLNSFSDHQRVLISRYIIHAFNMLIAVYTFAFPLIAFCTNSNLYKKLLGWQIGGINRFWALKFGHDEKIVINAQIETETYFSNLQNSWTKGPIKKGNSNVK